MHFSELCFGAKSFGRRIGALSEGSGRADAAGKELESRSSEVSSETDSGSVVSGTGMAAFLPVGRS